MNYLVVLQRTEYQRAEILVEAENEEEAEEVAVEEVESDDYECINADEAVLSVKEVKENAPDNE